MATALIVFSVVLYIADRIGSRERQLDDLTVGHGIVSGFAQALALVARVSRSGGTTTAGRFPGCDRAAAARCSFPLAVPAVLGSGSYQAYQALGGQMAGPALQWGPTHVAAAISFAVGLAVIA